MSTLNLLSISYNKVQKMINKKRARFAVRFNIIMTSFRLQLNIRHTFKPQINIDIGILEEHEERDVLDERWEQRNHSFHG